MLSCRGLGCRVEVLNLRLTKDDPGIARWGLVDIWAVDDKKDLKKKERQILTFIYFIYIVFFFSLFLFFSFFFFLTAPVKHQNTFNFMYACGGINVRSLAS